MRYEELTIEGRNAVLEAYRSGKTIDKLFVLDGCKDGPVQTILREAKKQSSIVRFVSKERLDQMSATGHHQGVIAYAAAYEYAQVDDILKAAEEKEEQQYEDMKLRIKYMYEKGDASMLVSLIESDSFADLVNKAEYIQNVHTYDRKMLDEYVETTRKIDNLKTTLEDEQKENVGITETGRA